MFNMKGFKKCGLLFLLFIIFGLSLNVSSDVNALKYAYDAYPLYNQIFYRRTGSSGSSYIHTKRFSVYIDANSSSDKDFDSDLTNYSKSGFDLCQTLNNQSSIFYTGFSNDYHQAYLSTYETFGKQFTNLYPSTYPACPGYLATRWSYDHVFGAEYNMTNGDVVKLVDLRNFLFDQDSSHYNGASIKRIVVPLNMDNLTHVSAGTKLQWNFGLVQKQANNFPYIDSNTKSLMEIQTFTLDPNTNSYEDFWDSHITISSDSNDSNKPLCSFDDSFEITTRSNELWEEYLGINVTCEYTPSVDLFYIYPSITLYGSTGPIYNSSLFLTYDYDGIYFTGSYLVTDNDDTWSGQYMNSIPTGDAMENNPSYNQLYGGEPDGVDCSPGDWLCDLTSIFNFSFINPFAPIFALFSDQNQCAQIPILASMINSDETQVCPWFDSNTRNIVTPVIAISSMMLLFGFLVRWLGARSGNFIEDSEGIDFGGYHFQNKFRRK